MSSHRCTSTNESELRYFAQWSFLAIHSEAMHTMPAEVVLFSCMRSLTTVMVAHVQIRCSSPRCTESCRNYSSILDCSHAYALVLLSLAECLYVQGHLHSTPELCQPPCQLYRVSLLLITFSNIASRGSRRPQIQIRWGRKQRIAIVYSRDFYT